MAMRRKTLEDGDETRGGAGASFIGAVTDNPERSSESLPPTVKRMNTKKKIITILVFFAVAILAGFMWYQWYSTPDKVAAREAKRIETEQKALVAEVKTHIILPEEWPVIYKINDPTLLASQQPFFIGSQKDDMLLVYPQSGRAIIYSPSRKLIVNFGPITFGDNVLPLERE